MRHGGMTHADGGVHTTVAYEYPDAAGRLGATGFSVHDVGKVARQSDDNSFWVLLTTAPTWAPACCSLAPYTSRIALAAGTRNLAIYTVPLPVGAGRLVLHRCYARVSTQLVGTGSAAFRLGTTAGGSQLLLPATITSSTPVGVLSGIALSSLGSDLLASNGYEAAYASGQAFYVGVVITGNVTGGAVDVYLHGSLLSL